MNSGKILFFLCFILSVSLISCMPQSTIRDGAKENISESADKVQPQKPETQSDEKPAITEVKILPLSVRKLDGYFFKGSYLLSENINFFVINSKSQFNEKVSETPSKKTISNISYDKNIAVIIALKPSSYKASIEISKAEYSNSEINIYFSTTALEPKLYYSVSNAAIFEIERKDPITSVIFHNGKAKKEILFGIRNNNSPKSIDELKKSYLGLYKGILPSSDLEDMQTILELKANSTYILKQSHSDDIKRIFETSGKWIPTDDLSSVVLNPDKDKSEHIFLYFIDNNTIEFFDAYGGKKPAKQYRLKK